MVLKLKNILHIIGCAEASCLHIHHVVCSIMTIKMMVSSTTYQTRATLHRANN